MNVYNEIYNFLKSRANYAEYREDYWGFVEDASQKVKVIVVTDPKSMRREYQYHYSRKVLFGFSAVAEAVAVDRSDMSEVEWYALEDALYYACNTAKETK